MPSSLEEIDGKLNATKAQFAVKQCKNEKKIHHLSQIEAALKIKLGRLTSSEKAARAEKNAALQAQQEAEDLSTALKSRILIKEEIIAKLKVDMRNDERKIEDLQTKLTKTTNELNAIKARYKALEIDLHNQKEIVRENEETKKLIKNKQTNFSEKTSSHTNTKKSEAERLETQNAFLKGQLSEAELQLSEVEDEHEKAIKALHEKQKELETLLKTSNEITHNQDLKTDLEKITNENIALKNEINAYKKAINSSNSGNNQTNQMQDILSAFAAEMIANKAYEEKKSLPDKLLKDETSPLAQKIKIAHFKRKKEPSNSSFYKDPSQLQLLD